MARGRAYSCGLFEGRPSRGRMPEIGSPREDSLHSIKVDNETAGTQGCTMVTDFVFKL